MSVFVCCASERVRDRNGRPCLSAPDGAQDLDWTGRTGPDLNCNELPQVSVLVMDKYLYFGNVFLVGRLSVNEQPNYRTTDPSEGNAALNRELRAGGRATYSSAILR